jgi:transposase
MKQKSVPGKAPAEQVLKDIRRQTRRHYSAEEKIRIVLEGSKGRTCRPSAHWTNSASRVRRFIVGMTATLKVGSKRWLTAGPGRIAFGIVSQTTSAGRS